MIKISQPSIGEEEKKAVLEVLNSGQLAQGEKILEFEKTFAEYCRVKHAIATNSGTSALQIALLANGIKKGDEVITTPFSFIATTNAILMCGAKPVFIDIKNDFNINEELIQKAITKKTKAILPVHLYGKPCNMKSIMETANNNDILIIEDACQAHGAEFQGKKAGSFGTGCFSFYPTKNMTTGEGGMITTNDENIAQKARMIINHGAKRKGFHEFLGYNYRMSDVSASIGIEQLKKLDKFNRKRKENALFYNENIQNKDIVLPKIIDGHVFHQYTIEAKKDKRNDLKDYLEKKGIQTEIFYSIPINKQKHINKNFDLPIAEKICGGVLSLPIHPLLKEEELRFVTNKINSF